MMKTKHLIADLLIAMAPAFFILILSTYLAGLFLSPPYDVLAMVVILAIGGLIIHFRNQIDAYRAVRRAGRRERGVAGHGASR